MTLFDPDLAAALAPAFDAVPDIELAIVYGSVANGASGPESDLDLAAMGARPLSTATHMRLVEALARCTGRPVHLTDLRETHGILLAEILRTGVRVVERDPALLPDVLRRHLFDEADFRPYRDRILAERRRAWIGA